MSKGWSFGDEDENEITTLQAERDTLKAERDKWWRCAAKLTAAMRDVEQQMRELKHARTSGTDSKTTTFINVLVLDQWADTLSAALKEQP